MGLPAGVDKVTLSGTFTDATGAAAAGTVIITPSTQVVDTVDGQIIHDGPITVTLDTNGHYTVTLCASDAANVSPSGFTYTVAVDLSHVAFAPICVQLPKARPAVDHSELVVVPASAGTVVAPQNVLTVNGHTGTIILAASDVGADTAGAATAAQTAAQGYTDSQILANIGGRELAFAQNPTTTAMSSAQGNQTVPGVQISPVVGTRPISVAASIAYSLSRGTAPDPSVVRILAQILEVNPDTTTTVVATSSQSTKLAGTESYNLILPIKARLNPAPGQHTYRVQIQTNIAGVSWSIYGADFAASTSLECIER